MSTYYRHTADRDLAFPALTGPADADVVIVGAGFAGLGAAHSLMEHGRRDILLLEAEAIGHGASGRNGGFVFGGFSLGEATLLRQIGADEARRLYRLTLDAIERIRGRITQYRIDCDVVAAGALLVDWFADEPALRKRQHLMREQFGVQWDWVGPEQVRELLLSERYHAALREPAAFHFHPLRYAQGLARAMHGAGLRLHEHSRVRSITREGAGWHIRCNAASVRCREVLVCGGGYLGQLVPELARAAMPVATCVIATEALGERLHSAVRTDAAVYDTRFAFDYYRALKDTCLLWGGRISIRDHSPQQVARRLGADLLRVYPQLKGVRVTHAWSGLMSYARHQMPLIGRLPDGLWYASGFGGHGIAPTTMAGELLAQALIGESAIPAAFAHFGLQRTFGRAGRAAAQAGYWWQQSRDAWRGRRRA